MNLAERLTFDTVNTDQLRQDSDLWQLYEQTFSAYSREPQEVIINSVAAGVGIVARARLDEKTIGLATTHLLHNPPNVFLVYLAVSKELQGGQIGTKLFQFIWQASEKKLIEEGLAPAGMVWEIESTMEEYPPEDMAQRQRRLAFYRRLGGEILTNNYCQPPLIGTKPVPLMLIYRPTQANFQADTETIDTLIKAMYFEKYGRANGLSLNQLEELFNDLHKV